MDRRSFLRGATSAIGLGLIGMPGCAPGSTGAGIGATAGAAAGGAVAPTRTQLFPISLAQWSLHRTLRRGDLTALEFPAATRERYGIETVEYVNQFFMDRARDRAFLTELRTRAADAGVRSLLIMCDGEGALGDPEEARRTEAVDNHRKWLEAARFLGCHAIRVNAQSSGTYDEQLRLAADGLRRLCEVADDYELDVLVENHGGLSSNGDWLAAVMEAVDHPRIGTLPDFGNFRIGEDEWYDRYEGVAELMPYAKAVSAKSHDFDASGNEVHTDYHRMMTIVLDAGYRGHVGIEYEGNELSEHDGILATLRLLERVRSELEPVYG